MRPVGTAKYAIEYGDESKSSAQLEFSDHQNSEAKIEMNDYLIEQYATGFRLSIESLLEEITPVVTEKHEIE